MFARIPYGLHGMIPGREVTLRTMTTSSENTNVPEQGSSHEHAPAESVGSRYVVTLGAQVFRMLLSFATAAIVPRALGPAIYGNYTFLLSTSAAIRGVLDSGTQQA